MKQAFRVLLISKWARKISTFPAIFQFGHALRERGVDVTILTSSDIDVPEAFDRCFHFSRDSFLVSLIETALHLRNHRYDAVVSFNTGDGEVLAFAAPLFPRMRFCMFSLEINYGIGLKAAIKSLFDRIAYRFCRLLIIQDALRLREFKNIFERSKPLVPKISFLFPNTYSKPKRELSTPTYWHDRFTIPLGRKIILYAGVIQCRERSHISAQSVERLLQVMPENWTLILSGTLEGDQKQNFLQLTEKSRPSGRFFLSEGFLGEEEFVLASASADAGLVWYDFPPTDPNNFHMGLAAGKFWRFLTLGKPSIIRDLPGLGDYARSIRAGIVVESLDGVKREDFAALSHPVQPRPEYYYESYFELFFHTFQDVLRSPVR